MRRREFVIAFGVGAGAGIAGYFSYCRLPRQPPAADSLPPPDGDPRPRLKDDVVFARRAEQLTIRGGSQDNLVLCAVNATGAVVIERLDGRHSIEAIAAAVATQASESRTEMLTAKVALFVAQLGACGFLTEPFYATLYEVEGA